MYNSTATPCLAGGGKTFRSFLDAEQDYTNSSIYSRELRSVIAECLLLTPFEQDSCPRPRAKNSRWSSNASEGHGRSSRRASAAGLAGAGVIAQWLGAQDARDLLGDAFHAMQPKKDREGEQRARPPIHPQPTPASAPQDQVRQAGRTQPSTAQPADAEPLTRLRVIIQTKAIFGRT